MGYKQQWVQDENEKSTLFGLQSHKSRPLARPDGRAMGRLLWTIEEKIPWDIMGALKWNGTHKEYSPFDARMKMQCRRLPHRSLIYDRRLDVGCAGRGRCHQVSVHLMKKKTSANGYCTCYALQFDVFSLHMYLSLYPNLCFDLLS